MYRIFFCQPYFDSLVNEGDLFVSYNESEIQETRSGSGDSDQGPSD